MRRRRLARLADLDTSNNEPSNSSSNGIISSPESKLPGPSNVQTPATVATPTQPTETPLQDNEAAMEVDDSCEKQCNSSGVDVDSGIENMEVEDSDRKEITPRSRVSKTKFFYAIQNINYIQFINI